MKKNQDNLMCIIVLMFIIGTTLILGQGIISNIRAEKRCTEKIEADLIRVDEGYSYHEDSNHKRSYTKEYTANYIYIVNNKTYSYSEVFTTYPDKQITIKYNPDFPSDSVRGVKRNNTISIIVICVVWVFGGSLILFIKLVDKPKVQANDNMDCFLKNKK